MGKWSNLTNDTRYFVITGGRGSGKSFEVGRFTVLLSYYQDEKILYTRQTMTSAHLSIIPEVKEKIEFINRDRDFEQAGNKLTNTFSGSEIIFKGLQTSSGDQTANLKSLTGVTCWVLDEAEEQTDEAKFDKIDLSFRKKGKQTRIILILNPASKAHWVYKRFFENKGVAEGFTGKVGDTTYIHTTYLDNIENLDQSFIDRAEDMRDREPDKYNHIMLGGWLDKADGVIIKNWRFGDFDETLPYFYGSDYGFNPDPDVLVKIAVDSKNLKLYVKEEFCMNECPPTELVARIKSIVGTSILHAESAEQRINDMLKRERVNVYPTKKYPGSVEDGLKMMQDYEIIVSPESTGIAKEFNNYVEKNGKPLSNGYDHRIDAIRYGVMGATIKLPQGIKKSGFKR
jgi:phage terminase large subunit